MNILGFEDHIVSVTTSQLYLHREKVGTENTKCMAVLKKTKNKKQNCTNRNEQLARFGF